MRRFQGFLAPVVVACAVVLLRSACVSSHLYACVSVRGWVELVNARADVVAAVDLLQRGTATTQGSASDDDAAGHGAAHDADVNESTVAEVPLARLIATDRLGHGGPTFRRTTIPAVKRTWDTEPTGTVSCTDVCSMVCSCAHVLATLPLPCLEGL